MTLEQDMGLEKGALKEYKDLLSRLIDGVGAGGCTSTWCTSPRLAGWALRTSCTRLYRLMRH